MSLKVLHVNDVSSVASNLVLGLKTLGVEAELFRITGGTYRAPWTRRLLLPITRTIESVRLRDYVKRNRFDIVHVHHARIAYMTLLTGLPYYLHCHGGDIYVDLQLPGLRELAILAIQRAQKVFCAIPDLLRVVQTIRPDAVFLPNPINTEAFSPQTPTGILPADHVLSISKLDVRKGVPDLIRAIELIWEASPNTIVGAMGFGDASKQAASFLERNRKRSGLKVYESLPHEQMTSLIQSHMVVLGHQGSRSTILNMSELEAMACAKPVVCRFEHGWAYPEPPPLLISRTSEEACSHVLTLLDDGRQRTELGVRAREWVLQYHEMQQIARRLLEYYRQ